MPAAAGFTVIRSTDGRSESLTNGLVINAAMSRE